MADENIGSFIDSRAEVLIWELRSALSRSPRSNVT